MQGRPFEVAWREPDTPEALKCAYQREPDPEVRTRLHGLWLLRCGWRLGMVAEVMGTHYRSVQRWVAWYREGGLPEVRRHKMGGRGTAALAEACGGNPSVRCGGHGAIPDRLGDSRLDRATVRGQLHPGWGLQPVTAAEVCPQSAPSGPRRDRPGIAGSLKKGVSSKPWPQRE
jgi:Homeodomain-like domain